MNLVFKLSIQVSTDDIDELNHANNVTYLRWVIDAAVEHSISLGYGLKQFAELGGAFVVRKHELEYLRPALLGEKITVETWISSFEGPSTLREYRILRDSDGKTLFTGRTLWVWVDFQTGRSKPIPAELVAAYGPFLKTSAPIE